MFSACLLGDSVKLVLGNNCSRQASLCTLWTPGAGSFFVVGAVLCIVGGLAASLASPRQMLVAPLAEPLSIHGMMTKK